VPYTKEYIENYRRRIKDEQDAEALMLYALYLIEAAKRTLDPHDSEKQARKYREALLSESVKIIKKLATSGAAPGKPPYADAQFYLANCYGNGKLGMSIDTPSRTICMSKPRNKITQQPRIAPRYAMKWVLAQNEIQSLACFSTERPRLWAIRPVCTSSA